MRWYVLFAVFFMLTVPAFADAEKMYGDSTIPLQLPGVITNSNIDAEKMCSDSHIPVERTTDNIYCPDRVVDCLYPDFKRAIGSTVCLTAETAEVMADKLGWIIINVTQQTNNDAVLNATDAVMAPMMSDRISDRISDSNNNFAFDFYGHISDNKDNIFFSPLSMYTAFSMLYEGADGNTAFEIGNVFGFESDNSTRAAEIAEMISSINRDDKHATLDISNAMWPAFRFTPYEPYVEVIEDVYGGVIENVDYVDPPNEPQGVQRINQWAAEKTNDRITRVITPDSVNANTAMVLTNAVYFNGTWLTQFPEAGTAESDFWTIDANRVRADFMNVKNVFEYAYTDDMKILKMPYKGDRLSMLVILPHDQDGIGIVEESLSAENTSLWKDMMSPAEITVKMPKLAIRTNYDLKPELEKLGMIDVFHPGASDLSRVADTTRNLHVSSATHDAFVKINEAGTEAAAVTALGMLEESLSTSAPLRFIADHPFIFLIQDDTSGTILFMGRISDPTI